MLRQAAVICLILGALGVVGLSFAALVETNAWWVRMADFPRLQYLAVLGGLLVALAALRPDPRAVRVSLFGGLMAAVMFNGWKLYPYFVTAAPPEISCTDDQVISILVANVQKGNRRADDLLTLVGRRQPDVFLALETDEWWDRRLSPVSESMPRTVSQVTDGYFGMHMFSRRPLSETEIVFPAEQDTPAILTDIELASGDVVRLYGMHPRPPHPGQDSAGRDAQLMWAALRARGEQHPVIIAGDLNATPWERTIERLQRIGRFLDPRREQGYTATYDATSWWKSWPIDQILHQETLSTRELVVHPFVGSDHHPIEITLCAEPSQRSAPEMWAADIAEAKASVTAARGDGTATAESAE